MLLRVLYEKFLINNKYAVSVENAIFSTLLIISSEIGLNIACVIQFIFGNYRDIYSLSKTKILIGSLILGAIVGFIILGGKSLKTFIDKKYPSNIYIKIIAIIYSLLSYLIFFIFFL